MPTTAVCPCCRRSFTVDAEGRLARHGFKRSTSGSTGYCSGSGRTPANAALRMVQAMGEELIRLQDKRAAMVDEGKTVRTITRKIEALEVTYSRNLNAL